MRLTIIPLVNPTEHQYQDLDKIWPDQNKEKRIQPFDETNLIYAARFNDRLLAAAKVTINQTQGVIADFCVREVTRRRGVGLYLLQEILRVHPDVSVWQFKFDGLDEKQIQVMHAFLTTCGFHATSQTGVWEFKIGHLDEIK
ncbi:aspartate 1-decarboxylase autocleavage activator PanM [Providencia rettgeri]|jgi:accessory colonization factor AcfC|uniref:aspartate 1-decarboxylase autocleavage activator PanM n=1 Tax=Providencia rettgeri TaxID=587 RepID=UPI002361AB0F|nr:aspartate 1-decarboxylase autocleavage activator PanM [Providencia rettgeri]MDR2225924.1 aspartate 1-decarboxylase autocleavage activator PanM [Providencia sp.]